MAKTVFSGVQPTGALTIGNYIGAMKNMRSLSLENDCIYCVVDLHSLTIAQDPDLLKLRTKQVLALYLAMGLDPQQSILFVQSQVSAHAELAWLLECFCYMGEASRMIQFKEKSVKQGESVTLGLLNYPVLMAADILLYNTDIVPVGDDQKQHLELARDIAIRINNRFGKLFTVPEPLMSKSGARIMSLSDPLKKMSKSDEDPMASVFILDEPQVILKKIKRAVTDSENIIKSAPNKAGINNLLNIYSSFSGNTLAQAENEFEGVGYGTFKNRVAESIIEGLSPVRSRFYELINDESYLLEVMHSGAKRASEIATPILNVFKQRIGLIV